MIYCMRIYPVQLQLVGFSYIFPCGFKDPFGVWYLPIWRHLHVVALAESWSGVRTMHVPHPHSPQTMPVSSPSP